MIAAALFACGIFYTEITAVAGSPSPDDLVLTDMVLTKHYGHSYFKAVLKSNSPEPLGVDVSVIGEDGAAALTFTDVRLAPKGEAELVAEGSLGSAFTVGDTYTIKVTGDRGGALQIACKGVEAYHGKMIMFNLPGMGSTVINSSEVERGVMDTATKLGLTYQTITSMDEWAAILDNPEEGLIIVNPYGNIVPAPTGALADPQSFLTQLGETVSENGWTWVHIGGMPFQKLGDGTSTVQIGDGQGIQWFLGSDKVNVNGGDGQEFLQDDVLTDDDGTSLSYFLEVSGFEPYPLPEKMKFDHAIVTAASELPCPKYTFYESPSHTSHAGARSFYVGETGYYVHWGSPTNNFDSYQSGAISLMMALYTTTR